MTHFDNIEKAKQIWKIAISVGTPCPSDREIHRWLCSFTIEELEVAFVGANVKFLGISRNRPFGSDEVYRYITSRLCSLRKRSYIVSGERAERGQTQAHPLQRTEPVAEPEQEARC